VGSRRTPRTLTRFPKPRAGLRRGAPGSPAASTASGASARCGRSPPAAARRRWPRSTCWAAPRPPAHSSPPHGPLPWSPPSPRALHQSPRPRVPNIAHQRKMLGGRTSNKPPCRLRIRIPIPPSGTKVWSVCVPTSKWHLDAFPNPRRVRLPTRLPGFLRHCRDRPPGVPRSCARVLRALVPPSPIWTSA